MTTSLLNSLRAAFTIADGALSGLPASKGGWGSYSMSSWVSRAASAPNSSATNLSAMSIPDETPGGREDFAVANDTLFGRNGTELFQDIEGKPMRGGIQALKHAGSCQ